jgi:hypothetical protein
MYNMGDKVILKEIDRCHSPIGCDTYIDPPMTNVEGTIVNLATFIDKRVCVEFIRNFQKHTVWKYEFDLPPK